MDKIYLGRNIADFAPGIVSQPITRVELLDDSGNVVAESGLGTGRTLTALQPDGTDTMAAFILAKVSGYTHRGYEGESALLDPAAELGDGISVNGYYVPLVAQDLTFSPLLACNISAPDADEIDDEYPYKSQTQRQIERVYARAQSLITKTSDEIALTIQGISGEVETLKVTLDGVTISDASGTTRIKGSSIDTTTLAAKSITADKLNLTGQISFGDLDSATQDAISAAQDAGDVISAWEYPGSTYIDGSKIMAGTVMASQLLGGTVGLLASNQDVVGALTIAYTTTGIGLGISTSYGGIQIQSAGNVYISSAHNTRLQLDEDAAKLGPTVWATDGTVIYSSDRNVKHDIEYDLSRYRQFLLDLKPCRFKYDNGQSGRFHVGLIAQDMERSLVDNGLTAMDFSGWCQMPIRDEEGRIAGYTYGIRYDSLIPLNTMMIQELERRVTALERRE
uniref:Endosialidase chaperone n=1 Tax=Siphoviridae sp. cty3u30 TaxID=2825744 RepID=A0A8S5Q6R0_9CAUD|nr:MAG TPA: endosialidase chaperone [Siphoviridae sp. cty3u30]